MVYRTVRRSVSRDSRRMRRSRSSRRRGSAAVPFCTLPVVAARRDDIRNRGVGLRPKRSRLRATAAPWLDELKAQAADKAVIDIVFSSVYGERWRIRSDELVPKPQ